MNIYRQLKLIKINDDILSNMSTVNRLLYDNIINAIQTDSMGNRITHLRENEKDYYYSKVVITNNEPYKDELYKNHIIVYNESDNYDISLSYNMYNLIIHRYAELNNITSTETVKIFINFCKTYLSPNFKTVSIFDNFM